MKKIKNPELYIERLKKQIARLNEWRRDEKIITDRKKAALEDRIKRAKGEIVTTWVPHEEVQSASSFVLATLRPNERIAIIGRVKKVESWVENGCDNQHSQITYTVLETRRIE